MADNDIVFYIFVGFLSGHHFFGEPHQKCKTCMASVCAQPLRVSETLLDEHMGNTGKWQKGVNPYFMLQSMS